MSEQPRQRSLAEAEEILRDLAEYENPSAALDTERPHVYRFRIPGKKYEETATVLTVEVDGVQLVTSLRALFVFALRKSPTLEGKDANEVVSKLAENSQSFRDAETDSYLFALRNLPPLMTTFFALICQMALVSPGTLFDDPEERNAFQKHQKELLEANLQGLRKDIKRRLKIRGRGGKTSTLAPDVRSSLHDTYDSTYKSAKTIKKHHDSLYRTFLSQKHRTNQWREFWVKHAEQVFEDQPKEFLELFSEAGRPSASDVAYDWVSRQTGLSQSYARKLIKELRKSSRSKKGTFNPHN